MSLSSWKPFVFRDRGHVNILKSTDGIKLESQGTAGGFVHVLPKPIPVSDIREFRVKWRVSKFPSVDYSKKLSKNQEDFGLRVGLLLDGDKTALPIPGDLEPLFAATPTKPSRVLFLVAVPNSVTPRCESSPYHGAITNCFKPASDAFSEAKFLIRDLQSIFQSSKSQHILGVWIFADSDGSHSSSAGEIARIEFH